MPVALNMEIQKAERAWNNALSHVTRESVEAEVHRVMPKIAILPNTPGIGKLNIQPYAEGSPIMNVMDWWRFARIVSRHDLDNLQRIFDMADRYVMSWLQRAQGGECTL